MSRTDITRAEIGPNTDLKEAAVALARHLWTQEGKAFATASIEYEGWRTGVVRTDYVARSLKAARRNVDKARQRLDAAHTLFVLADDNRHGRVHVLRTLRDAPQSPPEAPESTEATKVTVDTPVSVSALHGAELPAEWRPEWGLPLS